MSRSTPSPSSSPAALPTATEGLPLVLFGCLVNGLLAAVLFNQALVRIGAQLTGVLTYLEPLVASLVGIVAFHEGAGPLTFLGAGLVLATGVWVALERPRPQHPPHQAQVAGVAPP